MPNRHLAEFSNLELAKIIRHQAPPRPLSGPEIAYELILLGQDAGLPAAEIARFLLRLDGFPGWPDIEELARLMADLAP